MKTEIEQLQDELAKGFDELQERLVTLARDERYGLKAGISLLQAFNKGIDCFIKAYEER